MEKLFELVDGLIGDIAVFQGLQFNLAHGIMVIDTINGYEYEGEIVDGYIIDFVPFDDLQEPATYFALDDEGVKYIISEFILE